MIRKAGTTTQPAFRLFTLLKLTIEVLYALTICAIIDLIVNDRRNHG